MDTTPSLARARLQFPRLCPPLHQVSDVDDWYYPSQTTGARLQVWATRRGILAVVTHTWGTPPRNAPLDLYRILRSTFPEGDLIVIEHVPADDTSPEHWNQLTIAAGKGHWRRVWPVPVSNPDYGPFTAWARASATQLGIPAVVLP
jgi:hypothetical protein